MLAPTEFTAKHPVTGVNYTWSFIGYTYIKGIKYAKCQANKMQLPDGTWTIEQDCTDIFACPMIWHEPSKNYWDWIWGPHFKDKFIIKE